jgi:hypothetical protein
VTLTNVSVWIQVVSSGLFGLLYLYRYWDKLKEVTVQVLLGMTTCLFALTLDLAITSTNEGLAATPVPVLLSRIGFATVMAYGIFRLETASEAE